jgi:threonine/homoserine/homoserine lactone efflux protein
VDLGLLGRGFILGFTIAAAVGPVSLLVIQRTMAYGHRIGLVSGLGVATADAMYGAIAAFGLTALTGVLIDGRRAIGIVGGVFLLWLAWRTGRARPGPAAGEQPLRLGPRGAYLSLLALTLANPMTILSFAALFAGLSVTGKDAVGSVLVTAGVFAGSGTWWLLLSSVVAAFRERITSRRLRAINVVSGVVIGGFALASILLAARG